MKECCETGAPKKKRYWHWVVLGGVVLIAMTLQLIPEQIRDGHGISLSVKAKTDIQAIVGSLDEYEIDNKGSYPATLQPLVLPDANGHCYLEGHSGRIPKDPWKREYVYAPPTPSHPRPRVFCFGADGKLGGSGDDVDYDSDELGKGEP